MGANVIEERHYTVKELAEAWQVSEKYLRQLFRREPGVIQLSTPGARRNYVLTRVPHSVALRVWRRGGGGELPKVEPPAKVAVKLTKRLRSPR